MVTVLVSKGSNPRAESEFEMHKDKMMQSLVRIPNQGSVRGHVVVGEKKLEVDNIVKLSFCLRQS